METSATYHITNDLNNFESYKHITPMFITLPDGNKVTTFISGTVWLTPSLILSNVLLVPQFYIILLSVNKLMNDLHRHFIISYNKCLIL
ncbi:unnamed protein product [Lupinus luteus]|uniref:Retrovirus-related Pol polyprotein from transposon TNT 1-94-like beta-barrel domain-containing protein n=1 Tax=Lupinus luteus TaxID=3873 RepID=A0AAV1WB41_LUPLU